MKLLTKEIIKNIPPLYATDGVDPTKKIAYIKFFNPQGSGTWFIFEANAYTRDARQIPLKDADLDDVEDVMFFGYIVGAGQTQELGYFCLSELAGFKGRLGLGIERDMSYRPKSLADLQRKQD